MYKTSSRKEDKKIDAQIKSLHLIHIWLEHYKKQYITPKLLIIKKSLFLLFVIIFLFFVSCIKDTDLADTEVFLGKYTGKVTYAKSTKNITANNGAITVVKVGSEYSFLFFDKIIDLKGDRNREER